MTDLNRSSTDETSPAGVVRSRNTRSLTGAVLCKPGHGGNIYTDTVYDDFAVRLEFRLPPGGNNGLAIRYPGEGNAAYDGMTELQVLDTNHPIYAGWLKPTQYHGSAYGIKAAHNGYLRPTGQWNFQEVTVQGSTIKVELNGTVILDVDVSTITEYAGGREHPGKRPDERSFRVCRPSGSGPVSRDADQDSPGAN